MDDVTDSVNEYKTNGTAAYQKACYDEAVDWYTKAIQRDSGNAVLYNNRAAAYMMLNNYQKALQDSSKSIELDPKYCKALVRYLRCCICLGRIYDARQVCAIIRELDPLNAEFVLQVHQLDLLQQTYDTYQHQLSVPDLRYALHLINKCIEIAPGSLDFNLKKVALLIQLKRIPEAKGHTETILKTHRDSVEGLYYRGLCLFYMDHMDKALSHFQHVLRLHPDHTETQQSYKRCKTLLRLKEEGNKFIHERRFSKAFEAYTAALEVDPLYDAMNAKLLCNRACASYNMGKYEKALDDCNQAIALDPSYVRAHSRRAKCYSELEMYDEAVEEWKKVVKMDPTEEHKRGLQTAKRELARSKEINYYKVLGLKKNASTDEIKQAYKKLALQHHPDRHTHADDATRQEQEQKFKEVGEAYSVLSDPQKRHQYDNGLYSATGGDTSKIHAQNIFSQVVPGSTANGSTVYFTFS